MITLESDHETTRRIIRLHLKFAFEARFIKANGDERDMRFVLCDPSLELDEAAIANRLDDHDNMRLIVWDLDADAWRSIALDRVLELRPV